MGGLGLGGVVMAGERLVVSTGDRVHFLSQEGDVIKSYQGNGGRPNSPATADQFGNVFVVADIAVRSLDNDGNPRWGATPFPAPTPGDPGVPDLTQTPMVLSADGILFGSRSGVTYAIDAAAGGVMWTVPVADAGIPVGGAGHVLFLDGNQGTRVFDVTRKTLLGKLDAGGGGDARFASPYEFGGAGAGLGALGYGFGVVAGTNMGFVCLDTCGKRRWSFQDGDVQFASLIGVGENLISLAFTYNKTTNTRSMTDKLVAYDTGGQRIEGPIETAPFANASSVAQEIPMFSGADGFVYSLYCDRNLNTVTFLAFGPDLVERWRLDLGPGCPKGTGVMSDRGVVYLTRDPAGTAEVVAIQTASPGLARSSWPTLRRDNQGTSWLK